MSQGNTGVTDEAIHDVACPIREVIDRVGGKWSVQIILATAQGPVRFTDLERRIEGISRRMLTLTLRNLERDGLIVRKVYATVPPKVEYTGTEMSRELHDPLERLADWARRNRGNISAARAEYDQANSRDD
ncbi:winged helix-turn-helix transcriptional regulator [Saccharothrix obliqua]|uniref:winged helix-turn-helix transcriptional regulator n=1 Tax=Saccharothrix obliqua TaxID=2861747 RepID=UPI001C60778C|nr:helix-turn-helix domain-containing protein [Saccharothrix obliqua]MBW4721558.1 helix-turn-helix transcriptional regulator [Saccharothrix obliqua]